MADFSQTIGDAPGVATADPASLIASMNTKANAVVGLGKTIFDATTGIKKGMNLQELENTQATNEAAYLGDLKKVQRDVEALPSRKRTALGALEVGTDDILAEDMSAADIAAKSSIFNERRAEVLRGFEKEQERLQVAASQFPARERQYMLKSERILQDFIAKNPSYGQEARQIMSQTFGLNNIETYSERQLSDSIKEAEALRAQQVKAQQEMLAKGEDQYVAGAQFRGEDPFIARERYRSNPTMAANYAREVHIKKQAEDQIAKTSVRSLADAQRTADLVQARLGSEVRAESMQFISNMTAQFPGLTQQMLQNPESIPQDIKYDPKFIKAQNEFTQQMLQKQVAAQTQIDGVYSAGAPYFQGEDAKRASDARKSALESVANFAKNNPATIPAIMGDDRLNPKEKQEKLNFVRTLSEGLGIDGNVALAASTPAGAKQFPWAAGALKAISDYQLAVEMGNITEIKAKEAALRTAIEMKPGSVASTPDQVAGKDMRVLNNRSAIAKAIRGDVPAEQGGDALIAYARDVISNRKYASDWPTTAKQMDTLLPKLPESKRNEVKESIVQAVDGAIYGQGSGAGFKARAAHDELVTRLKSRGGAVVFATPDGSEPLAFDATKLNTNRGRSSGAQAEADMRMFTNANLQLANAEHALAIKARVTGTSIVELRKAFINDFIANKVSTAGRTGGFDAMGASVSSGAANNAPAPSGVTLDEAGKDVARTQANIAALKREIATWETKRNAEGAAGALSILRAELAQEEAKLK